MLVVTTENVPGYRVKEAKGQVFGVVVRSRGLGGNIMAGLRSIVGGEITEYTQLLEEARRHAVDRMVRNASLMQANAAGRVRIPQNDLFCRISTSLDEPGRPADPDEHPIRSTN